MAADATDIVVHGTAVALGDRAALLRGASGSGKSDLALRAITSRFNGPLDLSLMLVADDQVGVRSVNGGLIISPPAALAGFIEIRGLGIIPMPYRREAHLRLLVDLVPRDLVERLPDPWPEDLVLGVKVPVLKLDPYDASAALKLALALAHEPWRKRTP